MVRLNILMTNVHGFFGFLVFFGKHDHDNNDRDKCYNQCPTSKEALGYIEQLIPDDLLV